MKRAFTLIELLITIVLFSLLLATSLYSFRFISINIRNINNTNPQKAINYDLLRGVFNSIYYYIDNNEKEIDIEKKFYFYFYGERDSCKFITKSPLFSKEISLVKLQYKDNRLLYGESTIFNKNKDYRKLDILRLEKEIVILKNIDNLKFSYKINNKNTKELINEIPELVNIEFKLNSKEYNYSFSIKSKSLNKLKILKFNRKEFTR